MSDEEVAEQVPDQTGPVKSTTYPVKVIYCPGSRTLNIVCFISRSHRKRFMSVKLIRNLPSAPGGNKKET